MCQCRNNQIYEEIFVLSFFSVHEKDGEKIKPELIEYCNERREYAKVSHKGVTAGNLDHAEEQHLMDERYIRL